MCNVTDILLQTSVIFLTKLEFVLYPQKPLSKSQINKNYLAKLKTNTKYNEYRKKRADAMKLYRLEKKNAINNNLTLTDYGNALKKDCEAVYKHVKKHREYKKKNHTFTK